MELIQKGVDNHQIRKKTKQVVGVREVSFAVEEGESFVIMGLSGSGKSTLIRCINHLIRPTSGEIIIDGEDITKMSTHRLMQVRRSKMSMVFSPLSSDNSYVMKKGRYYNDFLISSDFFR